VETNFLENPLLSDFSLHKDPSAVSFLDPFLFPAARRLHLISPPDRGSRRRGGGHGGKVAVA